MDQKQIARQIMDLNKTAYDSVVSAMNIAWDQVEKLFSDFMDKAPWIPKEGKQAFKDWINTYKKSSNDLRNAIDENFKRAEDFLI